MLMGDRAVLLMMGVGDRAVLLMGDRILRLFLLSVALMIIREPLFQIINAAEIQ
jgi:hypothetical protein